MGCSSAPTCRPMCATLPGREFFIDNLLVRIHFIIVMIRWTGLAPWEFEFPFPGSFTSTRDLDWYKWPPFIPIIGGRVCSLVTALGLTLLSLDS